MRMREALWSAVRQLTDRTPKRLRRTHSHGSPSCPSADGHPETMKCHSERSEESCSALSGPPKKGQSEIPRFARNDSQFQSSEGSAFLYAPRRNAPIRVQRIPNASDFGLANHPIAGLPDLRLRGCPAAVRKIIYLGSYTGDGGPENGFCYAT